MAWSCHPGNIKFPHASHAALHSAGWVPSLLSCIYGLPAMMNISAPQSSMMV